MTIRAARTPAVHGDPGRPRPRRTDTVMRMRTRLSLAAAAAIAALGLAGCAAGADPAATATFGGSTSVPATSGAGSCAGVEVVVEYGELGGDDLVECVDVAGPTIALDVAGDAGLDIEGTAQYGPSIVCRVEGRPALDQPVTLPDGTTHNESCDTMPPMDAYWSLWLAQGEGEWAYAPAGIDTLEVAPGDRLGLVFTVGGESTPPQA